MTDISELITWDTLVTISNSAFTTSLVGALAGAYAGAYAAQKIAERSKERTEFQSQIRNTNTAITLSLMVCSAALSLKKQVTKDLCETYFEEKAALESLIQKREHKEIPLDVQFEVRTNLISIPSPVVLINELRSLVYEKLSISGRPLAIMPTLDGALSSLAKTIEFRKSLIQNFKQLSPQTGNTELLARYFGWPYGEGHVNTEYFDTMTALQNQLDDVIFFSHLLCKDLAAHGDKVLRKFKSQFKGVMDQITAFELPPEKTADLMPPNERHSDWLAGFPKGSDE
jgi:hypothetical protein